MLDHGPEATRSNLRGAKFSGGPYPQTALGAVSLTLCSLVPRPHPQEEEGLVAFEQFLGLLG